MAASTGLIPDTDTSDSGSDDLSTTLDKAQQALALDTGNLDDPRITSKKLPTPTPPDSTAVSSKKIEDFSQFEVAPKADTSSPARDTGIEDFSKFEVAPDLTAHSTEGRATAFATPSDLTAYRNAKATGASEEQALLVGDNGIGSDELGRISTPGVYGVAVPRAKLVQMFGEDPAAWRRARVSVTLGDRTVLVPIVDEGPGNTAQARGVVVDLTDKLSSYLGGTGNDHVKISFQANAGPDYLTERDKWLQEQGKFSGAHDDFSRYEVKDGKPVKEDFSQFEVGAKKDVARGTKDQTKAGNAFTDFWNNLFGSAGQTGFGLDVAKAKEDLNRALNEEKKPTLFGAEQEKEDQALKNPNISQADAEEIIEKRRQRTEMDKEIAQRQLKRAQDAQAQAESIEPGPAYQRTIPGTISSFLGSAAPYLLSGSLGAAAPITVATQMSEQAYGDTFDRGMKQGRVAHPDWSEERLRQEADKAARAAAQTGFENGVVMGLLPVPKVGPLVAQLVQRIGMRGAYMAIASASQDIEENIQLKKGVDQNQSIYEGVLKHVPANLLAGMAFEAPGAITEAVRARGGAPERAVPQEQAPRVEQQREPTLKGPPPAEPPPTEPKVSTEDPDQWVSAIANRYSQERSARGEIGEVAPGQGYATTDLIRVGERMKPEEINQHISDLMHDTGDPKLQAAAVRVEEARLSERSSRLSRIAENNPADAQAKINADNAFNDLTDFHNGPVAKLKNNWHAQGMTLQGEVPIDLGSFNGLREAWLRDIGTKPSPEVEAKMRDTAKRVREAQAAHDLALEKIGQAAIKSSVEKRLARAEEVRNNIMERIKDTPCL